MIIYLARRLGLGLLTLFLASITIFVATRVLPGDPAKAILGQSASPARVAALKHEFGYDTSIVNQYMRWIGGVLHGNFGTSIGTKGPVWDLIGPSIEASLTLIILAGIIGTVISIALGILGGMRRGGRLDRIVTGVALVLISMPDFIIAIVLVIVFGGFGLGLLPGVSTISLGDTPWSEPSKLILPVATLTLAFIPYVTLMVKNSLADELDSPQVQAGLLNGFRRVQLLIGRGLRNSWPPIIQVTGLQLIWLTGSIVAVEVVFSYPGIGTALVSAVTSRDSPVVEAVGLLVAASYVVFNILADILAIAVVPKVRHRYGVRRYHRPESREVTNEQA